MRYLLFLCMFLISCGGLFSNPYTDRELQADVAKLEQLLNISIDYNVEVENDLHGSYFGICEYVWFPTFTVLQIKMNLELIKERGASPLLVLLHEIGHCSFMYGHQPIKYLDDNCTDLIMSTGGKWLKCEMYLNEYIKQLKINTPLHENLGENSLWLIHKGENE